MQSQLNSIPESIYLSFKEGSALTTVKIDIDELAAEITRKIRDEISAIKIVEFAEVATVIVVTNGHQVTVKLPGAATATIPLDCLTSYTPAAGDWVMLVHPAGSSPVVIGKCPI
jgi:hypothetical protein